MSGTDLPTPKRTSVFPTVRRMAEALRTLFDLIHSIEGLKKKNDALTMEVDGLRREVDQQSGQIRILIEFVRGALDDRIEKRAEAAARNAVAELEAKFSRKPQSKIK